MRLCYTRPASRQLVEILLYLEERSPQGAWNVQRRLEEAIEVLKGQPHIGAPTNKTGYRRFVLIPYPYVILYQPKEDEIIIHSIRHSARKRRGW